MMIEAIIKSLYLLSYLTLAFVCVLVLILGLLKIFLLAFSILCVFGVWCLAGGAFLKRHA